MISESDILNGTILIVDDVETDIRLLERMLCAAGYTTIASTLAPHEVCNLHRKNRYDLILLDLQMPGMDGFQVMDELKAIETDDYLPVLVITAHPDRKLRALKAGAKDFISKPFDLIEVQARIHNMLEVRLLHKQVRKYSKSLKSLALHDTLTRLANRRLLDEKASQVIAHARRNKSNMAIVFLDLDEFKQIDDTLGHDTGDIQLTMAAGRLVKAVRQEDAVARLGGDEFVIVLAHT